MRIYIEMRLLGQSQTQSPVTKRRSSGEFGFEVSSDLGIFRCAVWHRISNNEMPEQSLSHSAIHPVLNSWRTGRFPPENGREQTLCWPGCGLQSNLVVSYLPYCPMPTWTSLSVNTFLVLCWRRRIFLFQPLSHSYFSDLCLKPGEAHRKKGCVANTSLARHPSVDRYNTHTPKCIGTALLKWCYNKELGPLALNWGWQKFLWLQPSLFVDHSLVISSGLLSTFQRKPPGAEGPHCTGLGASLPPDVSNDTLKSSGWAHQSEQRLHPALLLACGQPADVPAVKVYDCSVLFLDWEPV